ncbi:MAG: CRISPR-associated endonuclease Cas3'' [Gemmataceae bacterium]
MPVVIPLRDCVARPPQPDQEPFRLVTHLEAVAEGCGDKNGSPEARLAFLAGLAHDAAKAAENWQNYINSNGAIRKGPPHAPLGAALFAFWAEKLLPGWESDRPRRERLYDLALDWVRMIYRHHGALDDLDDHPPWVEASMAEEHAPRRLLATCDKPGLDDLVHTHFADYGGRLEEFDGWFTQQCDRVWHYRQHTARPNLARQWKQEGVEDAYAIRLANLGAKLIFADRRHAAEWEPDAFPPEEIDSAIEHHAAMCRAEAEKARKNSASELVINARTRRQEEALNAYRRKSNAPVFTLLLPTGYGKTLTGLRVALEAVKRGRKRLIYVAPYISILSQSARVIEDATGLPVFLHHHLSILAMGDDSKTARNVNPNEAKEDQQREDHQPYDLLDTWQAPIIATTFNQMFRALFPARAQECLRIPALDGAFIFIDEPQIVDVTVWCAFLRALAVIARQRNCQVLFTTATLPPVQDGLGFDPVQLVDPVEPVVCRYVIRIQPELWNGQRVADEARKSFQKHGSVATILNTVRDAVQTYQALAGEGNPDWFFLAAMMLSGHKAERIQQIKCRITPDDGSNKERLSTGVVCTQVLEAGVDLSFRSLLRAMPIFSSIAQAAGRANRHGEGEPAEVVVFRFVRNDGAESRQYVYRDRSARSHTDRVLAAHPIFSESQMPGVLKEYYSRCWTENPHTTPLQWFGEAARGKWSSLAGKEPFGGDYPLVDVLVPGAEHYLPESYRSKLSEFQTDTAEGLLERSLDRALWYKLGIHDRKLWFQARKRLSALLRQFTVAVPAKIAIRIAELVPGRDWLWRLSDPHDYSDRTGLAHHLIGTDEASGIAVI